jgi:hypothetical protein
MNLLQEIDLIAEETKTEKDLVKMFKDAKDSGALKNYVLSETYDVRPLKIDEEVKVKFPGFTSKTEKAQEGESLLRVHDKPNLQRIIDEEELEDSYAPIRPNEKPDAEGFTLYRSVKTLQAFQYTEDQPLVFQGNVGGSLHVKMNDYIARDVANPKRVLVFPGPKFEDKYTETK